MMFSNPIKKDAKEIANGILNTFRVGLLNTKYHPLAGEFEMPKTIYKDAYVLGFVVGFTTSSLPVLFANKKWVKSQSKIKDFIFEVYTSLGMSKDEKELCIRLMGDDDFRKKSHMTDAYDKGTADAQTMFGATYGLLKKSDADPLLQQARVLAQQSPDVLGTGTPESNLASAVGELTIWRHLKEKYEENEPVSDGDLTTDSDTNERTFQSIDDDTSPTNEREHWENRVLRNLQLLFDIDIAQITSDTRPTSTGHPDELDLLLSNLWSDDFSSLVSTLAIVDNLHMGSLLKPEQEHFSIDDVIKHYQKCKKIIQLNKLENSQFPFCDGSLRGDEIYSYLDTSIESLESAKKSDENERTESEKLISEVFILHRGILHSAKNCIDDNKRPKRNPHMWTSILFEKANQLSVLFSSLQEMKGEDYSETLKDLLVYEESLSKTSQQKIYDEIKASGHKGLEDNDIVKRLVLKDFEKLK